MSVKTSVLSYLEARRGIEVSGAALARELGVSRNAVWKAVEALRSEGHTISSTRQKGYTLERSSDALTEAGIKAALAEYCGEDVPELTLALHDVLGSTNAEAKALAARGAPSGTLVIAGEQTDGRGRLGRSFYSPAGTGIYMSLLLRLGGDITDSVFVTTAAAVAVCRAIERLTSARPQIKWVNDIYLDGKKICGILAEAVLSLETSQTDSVVVGIGVNISTSDFPPGVAPVAGSLGGGVTRCALIAAIAAELMRVVSPEGRRTFIADYRERSCVIGRNVVFTQNGHTFYAYAVAIDQSGGLSVRMADGSLKVLRTGEITLRTY